MSYNILVIGNHALEGRFLRVLEDSMKDVLLTFVSNGSEALEVFGTHSFDMLLSTLAIPALGGKAFLKRLIELKQRPALAVLGREPRSAWVSASLVARNMGFAVVGRVAKPLDVMGLRHLQHRHQQLNLAMATQAVAHEPSQLMRHLEPVRLRYLPRRSLRSGAITAVRAQAFEDYRLTDTCCACDGDEFDDLLVFHTLKQVISAQQRWRESGYRVLVWVKLPIALLNSAACADQLHDWVIGQGGEVHSIGFELNRTARCETLVDYLDCIYKLRIKGFAVVKGDFGQGYNNGLNLKDPPFANVHIFPALIRGAIDNERLRRALASIILGCHQAGLNVVAEGVATQKQLNLLKRLGCDEVQGPCIAEPLEPEALHGLLAWEKMKSVRSV